MNIGIFDSGNGGHFVAQKLQTLMPHHNYKVINDAKHAPYGERTYEDIRALTHAAVQPLVQSCPIVVIACNTATIAAIGSLREEHPNTIFVGFEPMIKPAAEKSKTAHVTLLATHATAHSPRTLQLMNYFAQGVTVDRPNTIGWASSIDRGNSDDIDLRDTKASIDRGSDVLIIGCTHYMALQPRLEKLGAIVLEPTESIARRIEALTATALRL